MEKEKHASYSSHDFCKSLSEELNNYYRGCHSSHTKQKQKSKRQKQLSMQTWVEES